MLTAEGWPCRLIGQGRRSRSDELQHVREDLFAECHGVRLSSVTAAKEVRQLATVISAHDVAGIVVVVPQVAVDILMAIRVFARAELVR